MGSLSVDLRARDWLSERNEVQLLSIFMEEKPTMLDFGQPSTGIIQFAYTVADVRQSAIHWTKLTGIGPWFLRGPFTTKDAKYRGEQVSNRLVVAQAFSGHNM